MSVGWGRGPRGEIGPRGTSKVVPRGAPFRHETGACAPPYSTQTPGTPYLTRGCIDIACIPPRLTKLQRSPEHKLSPAQVWTTGLNGNSQYTSPDGIILTDVAFNTPPELIFQPPEGVSQGSRQSILSPRNLLHRSGTLRDRRNSNIPQHPQTSFLSWISSTIRSGFPCFGSPVNSSPLRGPQNDERSDPEVKNESKRLSQRRRLITQQYPSTSEPTLAPGTKIFSPTRQKTQNSQYKPHLLSSRAKVHKLSPSLLDLQRERERAELPQSRYIEDIEVFHHIRRREIIAKSLYRESGQLFARIGRNGDLNPPPPPYMLLSGTTPLPPVKRNFEADPSMTLESRGKILSKIIQLRPRLESISAADERDAQRDHCNFAQDCLRAHNLYRARHSAAPLFLSKKLCTLAQGWANHLAQTGILRHKGDPKYGENIFCRNIALAIRTRQMIPDITGEEVAAYWYSNVRQYRFNLPDSALQAHAGSYSQMVWKDSKRFGVGKALSRSGKLIVVANYYPPGNISNYFRNNVLPLSTRALAAEMLCQGQAMLEEALEEPEDEETNLQRALMTVGVGVSGVLAAQPPNITGRNATKILAAHMLGHAATVITTPDEKLDVVVVSRKSLKIKKSKEKKQMEEQALNPTPSSPLDLLKEKLKSEDPDYKNIEKALKEVLNMKLKEKDSKSAPNIPTTSGESEKRPKLGETKRVKFKSEENIYATDRSKAVQTSFSSENLSFDDAEFDFPTSRVSFFESDDETISGWSETTSSAISSNVNQDKTTQSSDTISSTYDSEMKNDLRICSYFIPSYNMNTASSSYMKPQFQYRSSDTLTDPAPLASGEFTSLTDNPSCSTSHSMEPETISSSTSGSNQRSVHTPKMCNLRRIPVPEESSSESQNSVRSLSPEVSPVDERSLNSDERGSEDEISSKLNLPYDSPNVKSGQLNCYALSPLHY